MRVGVGVRHDGGGVQTVVRGRTVVAPMNKVVGVGAGVWIRYHVGIPI